MNAEQPRHSTPIDFLSDQEPPVRMDSPWWRNGLGFLVLLLALLALLAPLSKIEVQGRVGLLLVLAAVVEIAHGFRRSTAAGQRAAWVGGGITFAMGALLIHAPYFAAGALVLFLAGWFGLDGIRYLLGAIRCQDRRRSAWLWTLAGLGNLLIGAALLGVRGHLLAWTIAGAGALRIIGTASHIFLAPVFTAGDSGATVASDLGLPDHPEIHDLARRIAAEEAARAGIDRGWILVFIATLLAVHIGRMGFDRTFLGVMSPAFATLGDLFVALILAFAVFVPGRVLWRRLTRGLERRTWNWCLMLPEERRGWVRRGVNWALAGRLRAFVRLRQARYSVRTALSRGLQIGLPLAAIIAATVPVWGMSWYFDTENWAAGLWNSWAEERTDAWREAMVRAVLAENPAPDPGRAFAVFPPGVSDGGDFSFLVIGDTGEGDASQYRVVPTLLHQGRDTDFMFICSDVIYPAGGVEEYGPKVLGPYREYPGSIYAIPGNHGWFDDADGFMYWFCNADQRPARRRTARFRARELLWRRSPQGRMTELIKMAGVREPPRGSQYDDHRHLQVAVHHSRGEDR